MANNFAWRRIHLIPDSAYEIDKRVWPQGPPEYRFTSVGSVLCHSIPIRLGTEIERLLTENTKLRAEFEAFVREWSERFGFLATENPRDSIKSIDEVAILLSGFLPSRLQPEPGPREESEPNPPSYTLLFSREAWHEFQGRSDRDCELCGKPDRHPNHNPEGKFNG